ncbi:hypothetical protein PACTADRAFT_47627 [Pachysolen tannophilus NRRL Y-2460]|uniref:CCZ1/INTU/HSP4 first Longin domain-containing protein n=1 Tax=Pachysolen tannophilus NRRL Y-2460 TaxID=669874 RepID=A0A1E4U163_PACTA|nr:hypothetical protein PACTADRAFT_47627 [Pachysolen tannophilus NRRL Y-2460]
MINKDDDNIKKNQISQDSIIDLLNYIEEIEIKYGLDKIILKNLPPSTHQEQHQQQRLEELRMHATNIATTYITDPLTQIVYAPINAVNNFSEYLPTWKLWGDSSNNDNDNNNVHDNNTNQISNEEHFSNNTGIDNVVVNSEIDKGRFIVGYSKTLENVEDETLNIISKIIYLNSNDQKNAVNECKLVVYNIMNFNIFLIYKSDYPLLNEVNFYQDLKKFLYEDVYKLHLQKINNITTNKISPNISNNENVVINISSSEPFYYILIDENGKTYQTSLPYILEHNKNDELDKSNKSQLMHVHNNLISFYMSLKSNNEQVNDDEVLVKSFRNWWFFYKKFDSNNDKFFKNKKLIILKKTNHTSKNDDIKRLFTTPNSRKLLFTKNDHVKRHNKTTDNNNFYNDNQEDLKNENSDFLNFLQNLGEDVWEWYLQYKNEGIL